MPAQLILFVYNRIDHLKQTLKAVSENILAKDTELFVFSDGAKGENDRSKVAQVRRYIDEFEEDPEILSSRRKKEREVRMQRMGQADAGSARKRTRVSDDDDIEFLDLN